jgi:hypothetical protein
MTVTEKYKVTSAATLSGFLVRNRDSEDLGCIEELMVVPETGRVAYAVLSLGGLLGFGGKLYAVPWPALELDTDQRVFFLNADRETIAKAPAFHEEEWPDFADQSWGSQIHNYYGLRPYWEAA